jgi:putative ABC transport system ATP-binding protein
VGREDAPVVASAGPVAVGSRPGGPGATAVGNRVDLDDVCKQYRVGEVEVDALVGVDLHVDEASFVVILGPSGSGKTTLLNVIGLLDTPSGGRVRLAGRPAPDPPRPDHGRPGHTAGPGMTGRRPGSRA